MKDIQKAWIVAAIILLLLLLGGVGFYVAFEEVDITVREFPSEEAIHNPYLALERLADAAGFESKSHTYLEYPDTDWVLFLADSTTRPSPEQIDDWAGWVERQGGHLILAVPDGERDALTAPLVARLGFKHLDAEAPDNPEWPTEIVKQRYFSKYDIALSRGQEDSEKDDEENEGDVSEDDVSEDDKQSTRPGKLNGWVAEDADWLGLNKDGVVLAASRPAGVGRVTLLRNVVYFDNHHIGDGEHATLAMDMAHFTWQGKEVSLDAEPAEFSIVLHGERHSWMAYIFGFIWPALATLFIMLIFAILRGRRRFGPPLANPPAQRRSRMEHIAAVGRFLWNHDASDKLVLAAQGALLAKLERRNPQLQHATGTARWAIIADLLNIDVPQARQLFKTPQNERRAERFSAQIRALENYRRQL